MPSERFYYARAITQAETGQDWIDIENAANKPDDIGASVVLPALVPSRYLVCKDFGFNLEPAALIKWLEIAIRIKYGPGATLWYHYAFDKGDGTTIKAASDLIHTPGGFYWYTFWIYESAFDPHLYGADLNNPGLTLQFQFQESEESTVEVQIDSAAVIVLGGKLDYLSAMGVH